MFRLQLKDIFLLPAGQPPHKAYPGVTPPEQRLEMLRLATEDNPHFQIDDLELRLDGPSYTARTLQVLRERHPGRRLRFIIGSDEFASLPSWYRPETVVELAEFAVMVRAGIDFDRSRIEADIPRIRGRYELVTVPNLPLSSSDLRSRVRAGLPIRYLVPEPVRHYIEEHRLYTR